MFDGVGCATDQPGQDYWQAKPDDGEACDERCNQGEFWECHDTFLSLLSALRIRRCAVDRIFCCKQLSTVTRARTSAYNPNPATSFNSYLGTQMGTFLAAHGADSPCHPMPLRYRVVSGRGTGPNGGDLLPIARGQCSPFDPVPVGRTKRPNDDWSGRARGAAAVEVHTAVDGWSPAAAPHAPTMGRGRR